MAQHTQNNILLSVILPTFNAAGYIKPALDSLAKQNCPLMEVLIMDNQSGDNTSEIIKAYSEAGLNVKFHSQADNGIYDAMNKGIAHAKGEWVYFMGSDDKLYDDAVLARVIPHLKSDTDIVYGDITWMPEKTLENGEFSYRDFIKRNINHQRIFYRKDLFNRFGLYNIKYRVAADHELNIRLFCNDKLKKEYIPVIIAEYNSTGFSANRLDENFYRDWKKIVYPAFRPYLSRDAIYLSLGHWCRYCIDRSKYFDALKTTLRVLLHTGRPGFALLIARHFLSKRQRSRIAANFKSSVC